MVQALIGQMARADIQLTHAGQHDLLPEPYPVGRHAPDAIGARDGITYFGAAKTCPPDIDCAEALQQYRDFSSPLGGPSRFLLAVPDQFVEHAFMTLHQVGAGARTTVLPVQVLVRPVAADLKLTGVR